MGTILLLIITTVIGTAVGHYGFDAAVYGAIVGFVVGLALRFGFVDDAIDLVD